MTSKFARLAALGLLVALAACNTVSGFGQDMKDGGEALTGVAQNTKDNL